MTGASHLLSSLVLASGALGAAVTLWLPGTNTDGLNLSAMQGGVDSQGQTTWIFPPVPTETLLPGTVTLVENQEHISMTYADADVTIGADCVMQNGTPVCNYVANGVSFTTTEAGQMYTVQVIDPSSTSTSAPLTTESGKASQSDPAPGNASKTESAPADSPTGAGRQLAVSTSMIGGIAGVSLILLGLA